MALRLLEVTVSVEDLKKIPEVLEGVSVIHTRTSESAEGAGLMSILVEAHNAEAISDRLVSRFGSNGVFRLIVLPVEATLPPVTRPSEAEALEAGGVEARKPDSGRISREELHEDITQASRLSLVYLVMVALSTIVAAVGLIRGDVATVIGAMVIAPLLGPNVALSLSATLGDPDLAKRSMKAIGAGVTTALTLSVLVGIVLHVDPATPELAARTQPDIGDVVLALAAGAAGSLAFTTGVPSVVVGVMVAVALLPPLVAAGLLVGAGYWAPAAGAFVLVLTNVTCVNLAAVATFFLQKVSPRAWWDADRAKRSTRLAVTVWIFMLGLLLVLILLGFVGAV